MENKPYEVPKRNKKQYEIINQNYLEAIKLFTTSSESSKESNLENEQLLLSLIKDGFFELVDLNCYNTQLNKIEKRYDKTLELYSPEEWLSGSEKNTPNGIARESFSHLTEAFYYIVTEKKKKFKHLVTKVLKLSSHEISEYLFEKKVEIKKIDLFVEVLDSLIFNLDYNCKDTDYNKEIGLKRIMKKSLETYLNLEEVKEVGSDHIKSLKKLIPEKHLMDILKTKRMFVTEQSDLIHHNGKLCKSVVELDESDYHSDYDKSRFGIVFNVELQDGTNLQVFEDELFPFKKINK